jgi:hypothetical protein
MGEGRFGLGGVVIPWMSYRSFIYFWGGEEEEEGREKRMTCGNYLYIHAYE